jgi:hypothetical protein
MVLTGGAVGADRAALPGRRRTRDALAGTRGFSSRRCCGSRAPAAHGGTCPRLPEVFRDVEHGVQAVPSLGKGGCLRGSSTRSSGGPDLEFATVDGTIVKVHRHGQCAKGDSKPGNRQVPRRLDDQESSR